MLGTRQKRLLLLLMLAELTPLAMAGTTVVAGNCMNNFPHFSTIQAAVNAVPALGTVLVCPGNYPEQVVIAQPMNLTGVASGGTNDAVITSPPGGVAQTFGAYSPQLLVTNAVSVNITDIAVDGANNGISACTTRFVGILYSNSSGSINKVAARNQNLPGLPICASGWGIRVSASPPNSAIVTVQNSSVRAWQFEGIRGGGDGVTMTIKNNYVSGFIPNHQPGNAIDLNFGATGSITGNSIADAIWADDVFPDFGDATWGILVECSQGVTVSGNTIANTQGGIVLDNFFCSSVPNTPNSDSNVVSSNKIFNTQLYDAVYVCGNSNTVKSNTIQGAGESGIKLDNSCDGGPSGSNNTITSNTINESCAGILTNPATFGNTVSGNTSTNVGNTALSGTLCGPLFGDPPGLPTGLLKDLTGN
jgi:putative cofactor-binding repeat protein